MQRSETISEIAKALSLFQQKVKQPAKSADNPFFKAKYIPLENVIEAINTYGPPEGLSFTQWPSVNAEGRVGVATLLMHNSGEWLEFDPIYMKSDKDTAQGAGSVISYLKRYSLSAVYGITADLDDDGNGVAGNDKPKQPYTPKPTQSKPPEQPAQNGVKMITDPQIKAIGTKTGLIGKATGVEQRQVYVSATKHLKIDKTTRELTADEAGKVISYLATLE